MKTKFLILFSLFLETTTFLGQEAPTELKTVQLIEQRNIYLNGGTRAAFGGRSRISIKIDLPQNTKHWFYSFSTSPGESGTNNLNLLTQLTAVLADPTGFAATALTGVNVPTGSQSIDVYLCDRTNIDLFINKVDNNGGTYYHNMEGTVQNTRQGVIKIDDIKEGSWYLGLKNPSSLEGVNITLEVVAIVEETIERVVTEAENKATLYGKLGWSQFEKGDYQSCLDNSNKSIEYYELGWVTGNKGLSQLMLGQESEALETYIHGIVIIKEQSNPGYVLKELIEDIENYALPNSNIKSSHDIRDLLQMELNSLK